MTEVKMGNGECNGGLGVSCMETLESTSAERAARGAPCRCCEAKGEGKAAPGLSLAPWPNQLLLVEQRTVHVKAADQVITINSFLDIVSGVASTSF